MEKRKNIHLLLTGKPSRLFYNVGGALLFTNYENYNGVNIYITSDEEIKEGYYLDLTHNIIMKSVFYPSSDKNCKKIILTTDQDLIKNGVQSINDEFLKWFVKNPSCESIEVKLENYYASGALQPNLWQYKIIIPKEEPKQNLEKEMFELEEQLDIPSHLRWHNSKPKQETLVRDYSNRSCQTCNLFNTNNSAEKACELKLESKCASYANDETLGDYWISCLDDESDSVLYKQETIEEAAKNYTKDGTKHFMEKTNVELGFIAGAKWQQERMYSEEDLRYAFECATDLNPSFETFSAWFKQFKKKQQ